LNARKEMKMNRITFAAPFLIALMLVNGVAQRTGEWQDFEALSTSRAEVEQVLGKSSIESKVFGRYSTAEGEFLVWYSSGECKDGADGFQYRGSPNLMTRLRASFSTSTTVDILSWDTSTFRKYEYVELDDRVYFVSLDNSKTYALARTEDGKEFLISVEIQPSKAKSDLMCPTSLKHPKCS
jgi:hypothetical protein